jgi:hypothetical protein
MFTGPGGIITFLALAVASLLVVAFALLRLAASKAEHTLHPSIHAGRTVRRWAVVAIASAALSAGAAALAVATYVWCVGEC